LCTVFVAESDVGFEYAGTSLDSKIVRYILALDQGTTSSRAILFDEEGHIVTIAQKEFEQIFPRPGWVEHDPDEIWSTQAGVMGEALAKADADVGDVAAIGITNQRETVVVWDRATGRPVHNAIVWQDRRTAEMCDHLREEGYEELIRNRTGLVIDSYFSGTKVQWLLENVPGLRVRAEAGDLCAGTIDSWLIYRLTAGEVHVTDVSNASRTLLYNIHTREWDDDLLALLEIPRSMLPEVRSSSEIYGKTSGKVLSARIPIAGIAGDQQAALFGQMCTERGMGKNTYGTGCFVLMNTGQEAITSENHMLTTIGWDVGGELDYALEGSIFIGGAVVQWLRDGLGLIRSSGEVERLARSVESTDGVYVVPAFVGLGAPHWDPYARGTIIGITRGTTGGHIARAALESIALQTVDVVRAMEQDSGIKLEELRVDGGASVNDLLMQMQADLLGVPIVRPKILETTALGAAYLAGLAVGFWADRQDIEAHWEADRLFEPEISRDQAETEINIWHRAVERSRGWAIDGSEA
jgi:glycerol kinase